jgi:hypothetical protein
MAVTHTAPPAADLKTGHDVPDNTPGQAPPGTPIVAILARLTWMLFGPFVLLVSAFVLLGKRAGFPSFPDFAFAAAVGAMLLGRWLEFRTGTALTATGEPATGQHLRRYWLWAAIFGLAVWVITAVVRACW